MGKAIKRLFFLIFYLIHKFWYTINNFKEFYMSKPWSKLQREIYKLFDDKLPLQIHCRAYRMENSISSSPQIPRYWVTLGKDIIFDFPKNGTLQEKHQMYIHIPNISETIREYIDSPLDGLLQKEFTKDNFGISNILKAADRRLGKAKLLDWGKNQSPEVQAILNFRFK